MGLRDVVAKRKAERERPKTLAELRASKQAEQRPKTLAELRAAKQKAPDPRKNGLAALRAKKQAEKSSRLDFHMGGVRYHNVIDHGGWWSIDVSNGDKTYTLHNRCGAWMHDVQGRDGWMVEPVRVARALGTDITQLAISQALSERLEREMRDRGIPTREELLRQHEEEAKVQRRKRRKQDEDESAD